MRYVLINMDKYGRQQIREVHVTNNLPGLKEDLLKRIPPWKFGRMDYQGGENLRLYQDPNGVTQDLEEGVYLGLEMFGRRVLIEVPVKED